MRLQNGASLRPALMLCLASLVMALAWDLSALDLPVMQMIGDRHGFAWRTHPWLAVVMHDRFRQIALGLFLVLVGWVVLPEAPGRLARRERLGVLGGVLVSLLVINLMKLRSLTSCPWELAEFGGRAWHVSHWQWGVADGGSGRCFPGGHASSAMAFVGLALPGLGRGWRSGWGWLSMTVLPGLAAGIAQTLRGAHYPSHTLWTLVVCVSCSTAVWAVVRCRSR
ncbi:MAG: phosphatase PAP2 family protein [Hydrogenophaga sp.]|nr:phosphatase PAP2 family protein [Hydrogenophaga sp.]